MKEPDLYEGREQTLVKHLILQKYLERFAHIVGSHWRTITYVDCFSGPWNVRSQQLEDSSFSIALQELRKARNTHRARGRSLLLRCFFIEKDPKAFEELNRFTTEVKDAQIETRNSTLEEAILDIVKFVKAGGQDSFPFIFIDPTGWTGFAMDVIEPILQLEPGEVLINFMTKDIRRFIQSPDKQTQGSFVRLFGSEAFKAKLERFSGLDRDDAAVSEYRENVVKTGLFNFSATAIVLHPQFDRTNFHLIYATRHAKGIEVFKEAEKKAMATMEKARASVQQRKREGQTGQGDLFSSDEMPSSRYYDSLRDRYLALSRKSLVEELRLRRHMPYDNAWIKTVSRPLTWESDLKLWIREWKEDGNLRVDGLSGNQRVPQREKGNVLVWMGN